MKLLFCGPVLDFSGFAHSSRNFLRCLQQDIELDVVVRALKYDKLDSGQEFVVESWLSEALKKDLQNIDACIQMTTCNVEAVPIPGICNGLYTFLETDRVQQSWAAKAQSFDFLMVPCKANAQALMRSGVTKPILVCPPPCDTDVYKKEYLPFQIKDVGDRTVFYNICQLSTKKGIDALLRAYYAAFADCPDDVLLVLKTYINMNDRSKDSEIVKGYIDRMKVSCRIPVQKLPPVLPILGTVSDDEINSLHEAGHAYVCSSRAEGWGIPVFDALAHGKTVISNASGGLEDYVRNEFALVYGGTSTFFFDAPHQDPGLFTGLEQCFEPSPVEMAFLMRKFHLLRKDHSGEDAKKEWEGILTRRENASQLGDKFDYRVVSSKVTTQVKEAFSSWKENGCVQFNANKDLVE
jgi:glycosyltransferase involved in cell wall biosynthesis